MCSYALFVFYIHAYVLMYVLSVCSRIQHLDPKQIAFRIIKFIFSYLMTSSYFFIFYFTQPFSTLCCCTYYMWHKIAGEHLRDKSHVVKPLLEWWMWLTSHCWPEQWRRSWGADCIWTHWWLPRSWLQGRWPQTLVYRTCHHTHS